VLSITQKNLIRKNTTLTPGVVVGLTKIYIKRQWHFKKLSERAPIKISLKKGKKVFCKDDSLSFHYGEKIGTVQPLETN
jgi:hypothetical protein